MTETQFMMITAYFFFLIGSIYYKKNNYLSFFWGICGLLILFMS